MYHRQFLKSSIYFYNNSSVKLRVETPSGQIKEYQTRIIFKRLENDIICILGIFIKKDNNDIKEYKNIATRSVPQDLENALLLSSTIEDDLFKLLNENKRTSKL